MHKTTAISELDFSSDINLFRILAAVPGYRISPESEKAGMEVFFHEQLVARCFREKGFTQFLEESGINCKEVVSVEIVPSYVLFVVEPQCLFIIEVKSVEIEESVDEQLMLCDFWRSIYQNLAAKLSLRVEYVYVLDDWFKHPKYKDVLEYINSVNCHYKFNRLPLEWLGLPTELE